MENSCTIIHAFTAGTNLNLFSLFVPFFFQTELCLNVPGKCQLHIDLPEKVNPDQTSATFNTIKHKMVVKLPIQPSTKQ